MKMTRLLTFLFGVFMSASMTVSATPASIREAFDSLKVGTQGPTSFTSEVRTGVFFGGTNFRLSGNSGGGVANFLSLTPPRIEIGCNGIDATLGGFSMVNGDQIIRAIEAAIPAAAMYILEIVVGGLCEQCLQGVRSVLTSINNFTRALTDSCQVGAVLGKLALGAGEDEGGNPDKKQGICAAEKAGDNQASDRAEALQKFCKTAQGAHKHFTDKLEEATTVLEGGAPLEPAKAQELSKQCYTVNVGTFCDLQAIGVVQKLCTLPEQQSSNCERIDDARFQRERALAEFMMSALGTSVPGPQDDASSGYIPSLAPHQIASVLICADKGLSGNPTKPSSEDLDDRAINDNDIRAFTEYECAKTYGRIPAEGGDAGADASMPKIYVCANSSAARIPVCSNLEPIPLSEWVQRPYVQGVFGDGLLFYTLTTLSNIQNKIATNNRLSDQEIAFLQSTPFPLYKLVTLAVTFPAMFDRMVVGRSVQVSYLLAAEYIRLMYASTANSGTLSSMSLNKMRSNLDAIFAKLSASANQNFDDANRYEVELTKFTLQLENIEAAMRRAVYTRGLINNYEYSSRLVNYTQVKPIQQ